MILRLALAGWLSWLECCPVHQKTEGPILGQECMGGSHSMFLSHIDIFLSSLSPFFSF